MQNLLYCKIKDHFKDAVLNYKDNECHLDIYIPEINLGLVFDRGECGKNSKIQTLSLVESKRNIQTDNQQLYYEDGDFELLWNTLSLFINYNFDGVLWEKKINFI